VSLDPLRELRGMRVLVIHPADHEIDELVRHLRRIGCQARLLWPAPPALPPDADVVFFAICPTGPAVVLQPAPGAEPSLIAIVDYENPTALKSLLDSNAHCFINKPIRPSGILSSLVMARALHGYQGRLLAKVAKLEETLRSRREIERATRILMEVKGLSEDRAYQLIRQQATAQRLTVGVVARSIITAHRVFEDSPEAGRRSASDTATSVLRLPARKSP
jgi:AmiR/NasT family two-component response regulator